MRTRQQWCVAAVALIVVVGCAEAGAGNPPPRRDTTALGGNCASVGGSAGVGGAGGMAGDVGGSAGISGEGAIGGSAGMGGESGMSASSGGDGGSAGADVMCDLPEPNPEFICDPTGSGPCQNCHDCQQIESGAAKTAAKECGTSCGTDRTCTTSCVTDRVQASPACTECLADFYDCLIGTCLAECVIGGDLCTSCSRTKKDENGLTCSDKWFACSGTELNPNF